MSFEEDTTVQYELNKPPEDGITSLNFSLGSNKYLLASSWDTSVSLYDITKNERIHFYKHETPVLTSCFLSDERYCCSAGTDGHVILKNIESSQVSDLVPISGDHPHRFPVKCSCYSKETNLLFTGSWDTTVKVFDPNIKNFDNSNCVSVLKNHGKVFAMDLLEKSDHTKLIVATSNKDIYIWDLRHLKSPCIKRKSSLPEQLRLLKAFPKNTTNSKLLGEGFVSASTEGRAACEFLHETKSTMKDRFVFRCHRHKNQETLEENIYPVNCSDFSKFGTFGTGGSDGYVNIWDPIAKKRILELPKFPTGVVEMTFGKNYESKENILAVACSYNYESDINPEEVPKDRICIRKITDQELQK